MAEGRLSLFNRPGDHGARPASMGGGNRSDGRYSGLRGARTMEHSFETREALEGLVAVARSPLSKADTIPSVLYHSEVVYALDMHRIFAKEWVCPGLAADIPHAGDFITFTIVDY